MSSFVAGAPFSFPSPTDHQAGLWIACSLSGLYSLGILACRYAMRRIFKISDMVLLAGYVLALISWLLTVVALVRGTGKSASVLSSSSLHSAASLTYGSVITLILAVGCTLASQCLFLTEITTTTAHKTICYISTAATLVLSLVAVIAVTAGCTAEKYLSTGRYASCSGQDARWVVFAVCLAVATTIPAVLPPYLFRELQVSLSRKLNVFIAFGPSVFNVIFVALTAYYAQNFFASGSTSIDSVAFLCCLQIVVMWAFLSATVACARPLALKFTTAGLMLADETGQGSGHYLGHTQRSRLGTRKTQLQSQQGEEPWLRADAPEYHATVTAEGGANEAASVASFGSQSQFLRKTVETEVHLSNSGADD